MSRSVTNATWQALAAQETGEVFLVLLTILHPDLTTPFRFVNNNENIDSNGETFNRYPFEISLPEDSASRIPRAELTIDNVDRQIVQTIRSLSSAPTVQIDVIRAAAPDVLEATFVDFVFRDIGYDFLTVSGSLTLENILAEPYPAGIFSPADFPGLF